MSLGWHISDFSSSIPGAFLDRIYGQYVPGMETVLGGCREALGGHMGFPCPPFLQFNFPATPFSAPVGWEWDMWPSLCHFVDKWDHLVALPHCRAGGTPMDKGHGGN